MDSLGGKNFCKEGKNPETIQRPKINKQNKTRGDGLPLQKLNS